MKLAVIGAGQMGQALIKAFASEIMSGSDIAVYDVDTSKTEQLVKELDCIQIKPADIGMIAQYDAVLLAVKPQVLKTVVDDIKAYTDGSLIVSIVAGRAIADYREMGFIDNPIARIMPNTPALVGSAVSGISFSENVDAGQKKWVLDLFSSCGHAYEVNENLLDAVTGLSGSGPAYMMMVIEALADGGVRQGLTREQAIKMAAMTMIGSARLVLETGQHPGVLKDQVCSPGGTTIEAVAILEERGLRSALIEAVAASAGKARELGRH